MTQNICVKARARKHSSSSTGRRTATSPTDVAVSSANFGMGLPLGCLAFVGCKNDALGHYTDPLFPILPNLRLLCESTVFCKQVYRNTRLQPLRILQGKFKAMKKYELFFHEPIEKRKKKTRHPEKTHITFQPSFASSTGLFPTV